MHIKINEHVSCSNLFLFRSQSKYNLNESDPWKLKFKSPDWIEFGQNCFFFLKKMPKFLNTFNFDFGGSIIISQISVDVIHNFCSIYVNVMLLNAEIYNTERRKRLGS